MSATCQSDGQRGTESCPRRRASSICRYRPYLAGFTGFMKPIGCCAAHSADCEKIVDKLLTHWGDVALSLLEHTKKEHRKGMDLAQVTDTLFGKANSSEICSRTSADTADLQSISEALILYKARQMQESRAWFAGKRTTDEMSHAKRGAKLLTTPAASAAPASSTAAQQPQSANASSTEPKPKNAVVSARVVPKQNISCKVLAGTATGGGCCGGSKDDLGTGDNLPTDTEQL